MNRLPVGEQKRCLFGPLAVAVLTASAAWCSGQETQTAASQPGAPLRTWAVLASQELRASGLEDQVLAGLGSDKTITLVDREHLDLVAKELALSGLLEARGVDSRRKAGAAVRADALAILNLESADGERFVRLVVCGTGTGARLLEEFIVYDAQHPDKVAKAIVAAITQTRRRFPQGVQRVYAVPPFVSRNLGHEYDHLQRGCANLLAQALSSHDGVAVVEIDEARQLASEIALTDGGDIHRIVPMFIEGEYEMFRTPKDQKPDVSLGVTIKGNGQPVKLPVCRVKPAAMAGYLSNELPALILGDAAGIRPPLTVDQQASATTARADIFARLGAWEHSTALREAALLLKDDAKQRETLVEEYCWTVTSNWPKEKGPDDKYHLQECLRRAELWRAALSHVEYLIRNQQATFDEIMKLSDDVLHSASAIRGTPNEAVPPMEITKRRFLKEVWPLAMDLKYVKPYQSEGDKAAAWTSLLVKYALYNYETNSRTPAGLEFLASVLLEMAPADQLPPSELVYRLGGFLETKETAVAAETLLDKLIASNKPGLALLARECRLHRQWLKKPQDLDLKAFHQETSRLAEDYCRAIRTLLPHVGTEHFAGTLGQEIHDLDARVAYAIKTSTHPEHAAVPTSQPEKPPSPVEVEPVALKVKLLSGEVVSLKGKTWRAPHGWGGIGHMIRCGEVDVFRNDGALLVMREKGLLEEIVVDEKDWFWDVKWDGQNLWVGTRNDGIRIIDLTGRVVCRIGGKEGLPDADRGMRICPIAPGKAVVAGGLGEHKRLWVAMVQVATGDGSVKVFHQATRVLTVGEDWSKVPPALDLAGEPYWIHLLSGGKKDVPPRVLLGWGLHRRPMQIECDSLKVSLFDKDLSWARDKSDESYLSRDGRLIEAGAHNVLLEDGADIYQTGLGIWWRLDAQKREFTD